MHRGSPLIAIAVPDFVFGGGLLPSINIVVPMFAGILVAISVALMAAPAGAATGYQLDGTTPQVGLGGESLPHGIAVDQASRRIYVAITISNSTGAPGNVTRFESDFTPAGTVSVGDEAYYGGVAVNPSTQQFYASQARFESPFMSLGTTQMDIFSSAGVSSLSFALDQTGALPQIASDLAGHVYFPNAATDSVQVFDSSGALQEQISCGGCPGGGFGEPVSVALDSGDDLYVVDLAPNRVVKLTPAGGAYVFDSVLQVGQGAAAVGVDPSTDDVFVGNLPNGVDYHIVAYDSSGVPFDDFGAGLFTDPKPEFGAHIAAQIAVDATSRDLFVGDLGKFYVFERTTIAPPTAATKAPAPVGQLEAILMATVNANGHAVLECEFEYTDHADFEANAFDNATTAACPKNPDGSEATALARHISGLSPSTTYHYRITARSHAGTSSGDPAEFETLPATPPTVTAESASGVTQSGATLRSKANPSGGSVTDCHFEFGASTDYGTELPCATALGLASTDVPQSYGISGLEAGTTYHYRLVVTSNAGTAAGEDVVFATDDPPPEPIDDSGSDGGSGSDGASVAPPPVLAPPPVAMTPVQQRPRCRRGFRPKRVRGKVRCVSRCRRGFKQKRVRGGVRCLNKCRRGFRKARVRIRRKGKVRHQVRCVKVKRKRAAKPQRRHRNRH